MSTAPLPSGISLEYDTFGSPSDPALLLVMGFGAQMIVWDEGFCQRLAERGRFVIRFDNRDCGLSGKLDGWLVDARAIVAHAILGGPMPEVPYTLSDMAADGVGLLDHLGIERAHVVGASMGGMIVQTMAIEHPGRLLSITSIMSTIGDMQFGQPSPEAMVALLSPPPRTREEAIARSAFAAAWGSKRYFDPGRAADLTGRSFDRSFYPEGISRQMGAMAASGDRTELLPAVTTPTLVIHGLDDRLIDVSGGRRTAELIPGAHLLEVADMGHDMPEQLWPLIIGAIIDHGDIAAASAVIGASA
jgi:pimeloyl-ACP methyl ester carboxylesterase